MEHFKGPSQGSKDSQEVLLAHSSRNLFDAANFHLAQFFFILLMALQSKTLNKVNSVSNGCKNPGAPLLQENDSKTNQPRNIQICAVWVLTTFPPILSRRQTSKQSVKTATHQLFCINHTHSRPPHEAQENCVVILVQRHQCSNLVLSCSEKKGQTIEWPHWLPGPRCSQSFYLFIYL